MADLIVNDVDYESISADYKELGKNFEEILSTYLSVLDDICTSGIKSGNIHDNLVIYKETASQLSGQIDAALGIAARICTDFVSDIDTADGALY